MLIGGKNRIPLNRRLQKPTLSFRPIRYQGKPIRELEESQSGFNVSSVIDFVNMNLVGDSGSICLIDVFSRYQAVKSINTYM